MRLEVDFCDIGDCKNNDCFEPMDIYMVKTSEFKDASKNKAGYKFNDETKDICEIHLKEINELYPDDKPFLIVDKESRWNDLIVNPIYKGLKNEVL